MTDEPKKPNNQLSILPGLILMGAIALVIGIGVFVLNLVNQNRSQKLKQEYTAETLAFIEANQAGLNTLFTQVFERADTCTNTRREISTLPCDKEISNEIFTLVDLHPLKDFSSTSFVRLHNNEVQRLSLSGYVSEYTLYEPGAAKMVSLLRGELGVSYLFPEKYSPSEVVVVVKEGNSVLGAIVRPVLER